MAQQNSPKFSGWWFQPETLFQSKGSWNASCVPCVQKHFRPQEDVPGNIFRSLFFDSLVIWLTCVHFLKRRNEFVVWVGRSAGDVQNNVLVRIGLDEVAALKSQVPNCNDNVYTINTTTQSRIGVKFKCEMRLSVSRPHCYTVFFCFFFRGGGWVHDDDSNVTC